MYVYVCGVILGFGDSVIFGSRFVVQFLGIKLVWCFWLRGVFAFGGLILSVLDGVIVCDFDLCGCCDIDSGGCG